MIVSAVLRLWGFIMFRVMMVTGLVLSVSSFGAVAFEQTNELPKPTTSTSEPASTLPVDGALELTVPEAAEAEESGPTISLPGIGAIGTLPKFDFGLELLYGEDTAGPAVDDDAAESDLRIRGSVKHKF